MTTTMYRDTDQARVYTPNPDWLPQRIPTWMTIARANEMFGYRDHKALADRAKRLGVTKRNHPYDRRKKQLLMPELLARMDFDIDAIQFTSGADYVKPGTKGH
jgi:hypothetical protein